METIYTFRGHKYATYEDAIRNVTGMAWECFDDYLDDVFEDINICGLLYRPSIALKKVDEIAYREAFLEYSSLFEEEIEELEIEEDEYDDEEFE